MKGLAEMLSVYKRLIEKNDRYIWVIIGDGPLFAIVEGRG